mmetsp:Transcript_3600/g.6648  ORF Transcript_3600/g.6648 Transcript_3600/m.6648 type:complete len:250 (-) Transcript_3600:188-937(-)
MRRCPDVPSTRNTHPVLLTTVWWKERVGIATHEVRLAVFPREDLLGRPLAEGLQENLGSVLKSAVPKRADDLGPLVEGVEPTLRSLQQVDVRLSVARLGVKVAVAVRFRRAALDPRRNLAHCEAVPRRVVDLEEPLIDGHVRPGVPSFNEDVGVDVGRRCAPQERRAHEDAVVQSIAVEVEEEGRSFGRFHQRFWKQRRVRTFAVALEQEAFVRRRASMRDHHQLLHGDLSARVVLQISNFVSLELTQT